MFKNTLNGEIIDLRALECDKAIEEWNQFNECVIGENRACGEAVICAKHVDKIGIFQKTGKSPGDAYVNGLNIRLWLQYGISDGKDDVIQSMYTVKEKNTEEVFRFAIRGCVIPPGLG